jgi:hypothetical protein
MEFKRLTVPNTTTIKAISSVYTEYLETARLDLSPSYQRARCWSQRQCNGLIDTIMHGWPTPLFTFYRLPVADGAKRYECVDGQNRLYAIKAFRTGTPILNDKSGKEEHVTWTGQTGDKKLRYVDLSDEECEWFDTYELTLTIIQSPMDLDSRKAMFTRLQDGSKISTAEYVKNTEHPVSQFISRTGLRDKFLPVATGMMMAAKGEWMDVLADCVTLYIHRADADPLASLGRTQADLRAVLKGVKSSTPGTKYDMPLTPADDATLTPLFDQLIATLSAVKAEKVKCHKFHVTLLFLQNLKAGAIPSVTAVQTWFKGAAAIVRETKGGGVERALEVYREHQTSLTVTALPPAEEPAIKRRAIPKKKRDALWYQHFGVSGSGACLCCDAPILFTRWEQAHVTAVAEGGSNDLENLRPTCVGCNRSCGTENLLVWCAREYPSSTLLRTE